MLLNPPPDTLVEEGDALVLLAEDESHLAPVIPQSGPSPTRRRSLFQAWPLRATSGQSLRELVLKAAGKAKGQERESNGSLQLAELEEVIGAAGQAAPGGSGPRPTDTTAAFKNGPIAGAAAADGAGTSGVSATAAAGAGAGVFASAWNVLRASPVFARLTGSSSNLSPPAGSHGREEPAPASSPLSPAGSERGGAGDGPEWAGPSLSSGLGPGSRAMSGANLGRGSSLLQRSSSVVELPSVDPDGAAVLDGPPRAGGAGAGSEGARRWHQATDDDGGSSPPLGSFRGPGRASSVGLGLGSLGSGPQQGSAPVGPPPPAFHRTSSITMRRGHSRGLDTFGAGAGCGPGPRPGGNPGVMNGLGSVVTGGGMAFGGRFLFCGWPQDIVALIRVLDEFCTVDSELWLLSDVPLEARPALLMQVRDVCVRIP